MDKENRIFVYGSLMQGFHNHFRLDGADFVGEARLLDNTFTLYDMGAFPAMVEELDGFGVRVEGEVYLVSDATLEALDRLEGHPRWYRRHRELLEDGTQAWVYVLPHKFLSHKTPRVPGPSWRAYFNERAAKAKV